MRTKLPKLVCNRYVYSFSEGWEVVWFAKDPSKPRGQFNVSIKYHHESGGDSYPYEYPGPASLHSSLHLIKMCIKNKYLPKT